jgi:TP901 family phage tail tape measure protein
MAIFIPLVTKFDPKGLQGAQRALANFQNFAVDVGRVAAAAISAVAVASVREAAQFETTFAKIQGLVGLTADEIGDLEKAARNLGPQFGKSGNEAADALFFITSAGLRGATAVDVLEASLKGAAIGLGDVGSIANAATAAMNTYGESNLSGTDAVEALAEAVRLGQFAPEELAGALGRVIPISAELGVSFQETTGLIAALTKGGLSASEAVTGIRGAMQAFIKPTEEAKKMMEEYGLTSEGVAESIEQDGFLSTMTKLREAFGDNQEDFTKVIGSIEGLSAVFSLTGENTEAYAEIVRLATDDINIMDEALGFVADTSKFKFDVAMATARDSLLEIGAAILDKVAPHLDSFILWMETHGPTIEQGFIKIFDAIDKFITSEVLANIIQSFADMWPEIEDTIESLGNLVLALSPLLEGTLDNILPMIQDMASIMADIGFFVDEAVDALGGWESDSPSFIRMLELQLNPMLRLAGALRQLAELFDRARAAFERFKAAGGLNSLDVSKINTSTLGGRRASGGPVAGGSSYLVGEMGPELFTPAAGGGRITPNNSLGGSNITINVNAGMGANGAQIGEQIVTAIKRYERTSGPVFASA